ncbi:hypothetical protein HJFPF1_06925 [Paramyrothecium foliicola]|nr:hypothetical protein HJFPF1_06925 [Paramyrothecium foliicola]
MSARPLPQPGLYKRPVFEPQCTHLSMTRLYDPDAACLHCRRPGPFGWVYQCTQDREEVLEQAAARGELTAFDDLGRVLGAQLQIRQRSPAARQDRLSFFNEVTPKQMSSYRPEHIAAILRQRENVHLAVESDRIRRSNATILGHLGHHNLNGASANVFRYQPPWIHSAAEECRYWVCPNCRPSAADRAYLSIDAVAGGEIAPTAAVGYGFHVMGERPVINANLVKSIGCRAVPKPSFTNSSDSSSFGSDFSVMELLDHQIAQGHIHCTDGLDVNGGDSNDKTHLLLPPAEGTLPAQLRHPSHFSNPSQLSPYAERNILKRKWPFERPPKSDLVSLHFRSAPYPYERSLKKADAEHHTLKDKRAATSNKEERARRQDDLADRIPHSTAPDTHSYDEKNPTSASFNHANIALALPLMDKAISSSSKGTISGVDDDSGETFHAKLGNGFEPAPLKVGHGVAVLEESVEFGVPDVITQA